MPKQTFLDLPEAKRQAFTRIALTEFAANDYNTASVSKIVEKAGIAKGSLYQYFENKQELFVYLLDLSSQTMLEYVRQSAPPASAADFFELLRWQMSATVQAALAYPLHSRLLRRAYSSPLPFRDALLEKAREVRAGHFQAMVAQAQSSGHLDSSLDPGVVTFMLEGLMDDLGPFLEAKFTGHKGDWIELPEVGRIFDQVIKVLKNGLAV